MYKNPEAQLIKPMLVKLRKMKGRYITFRLFGISQQIVDDGYGIFDMVRHSMRHVIFRSNFGHMSNTDIMLGF